MDSNKDEEVNICVKCNKTNNQEADRLCQVGARFGRSVDPEAIQKLIECASKSDLDIVVSELCID